MHHPTLCAVAVSLLAALPGAQAGMYTKKSPVLQVDAKDYDRLIAKSNHTSIVEFYAPWCGHCQNLKPAYEKAAKNLEGLAKVAAVDCDDDANKPFCGTMGVQGFPTLKIVRPKKGGGKPTVEDYQGPRTASGIVDAVVQRINNNVKKIEDKNVDQFLSEKNETAKAILFTDKGTTSALMKSLAIDFLDVITIGQARNKETKTVEMFGVEKFPTLILLPGGDKDGIVYDGEIKKHAMVKFLSQAGEPNPDPAPLNEKKGGDKDKKEKASSSSKTKTKTTSSESSSASTGSETEAPTQEVPVIVETALPIPAINTQEKLIKECLTEKSHTCVLAFVPADADEKAKEALTSLSDIAHKYAQSKRHLFPMFEVPKSNEGATWLLKALGLSGDVEIIAINARRGWWRHYEAADFGHESIEDWIDAIRLGEGAKKKLPEGIVAISVEKPSPAATPEASSEVTPDATESVSNEDATPVTAEASSTDAASDSTEPTSTKGSDPTAEPAETPIVHEEL
ncbi:protein disulfide-isomerase MPD1 [Diplogelasinospora grovesii]|uniref:protein disulfide-isomerase n=1 Tax=Diplogelasinospora grovesii TaxID=303347 RepID=A0AAN6RZY3_9PEZI|nr:protein disulfide-isomerase MPD1 [Diplogelasinospora grovesii]